MNLKEGISKIRDKDWYAPTLAVIFFALVLSFIGMNLEYFPKDELSIKPLVNGSATVFNSVRELSGRGFLYNSPM